MRCYPVEEAFVIFSPGKSTILLSPALPVKKGEDVTLHCKTGSPDSKFPASFFRNGFLIGNGPAGHMTIHNISESNQGDYRCEFIGSNRSPPSWLLIEGKHPDLPSASQTLAVYYEAGFRLSEVTSQLTLGFRYYDGGSLLARVNHQGNLW